MQQSPKFLVYMANVEGLFSQIILYFFLTPGASFYLLGSSQISTEKDASTTQGVVQELIFLFGKKKDTSRQNLVFAARDN